MERSGFGRLFKSKIGEAISAVGKTIQSGLIQYDSKSQCLRFSSSAVKLATNLAVQVASPLERPRCRSVEASELKGGVRGIQNVYISIGSRVLGLLFCRDTCGASGAPSIQNSTMDRDLSHRIDTRSRSYG
jgi:hypothetical protein